LGEGQQRLPFPSVGALGHLHDATAKPRVGVHVVSLHQAVAHLLELLSEERQQSVLHVWVGVLEQGEVVAIDGARLPSLQRRHRGRPTPLREEERELAEDLPGAEHVEDDCAPERRGDSGHEVARDDEVERVGHVATVEDDLASLEGAPAGDGEQRPHPDCRNLGQKRPVHDLSVS